MRNLGKSIILRKSAGWGLLIVSKEMEVSEMAQSTKEMTIGEILWKQACIAWDVLLLRVKAWKKRLWFMEWILKI